MKELECRPFLVCHDYGQGGVWWWWITAPSVGSIKEKYRDVHVFDQPPSWWRAENEASASRRELDDPPDPALKRLER